MGQVGRTSIRYLRFIYYPTLHKQDQIRKAVGWPKKCTNYYAALRMRHALSLWSTSEQYVVQVQVQYQSTSQIGYHDSVVES